MVARTPDMPLMTKEQGDPLLADIQALILQRAKEQGFQEPGYILMLSGDPCQTCDTGVTSNIKRSLAAHVLRAYADLLEEIPEGR